MRTFSFKLPNHLDDLLEQLARERGRSRSAVLREALEAYAARPKVSALDMAADLVGSLKGLPRDLSANRKYMEGYGK